MRKMLIPVLISGICILAACKDSPTTPNLPNAFELTSINTHNFTAMADLSVKATYQNHDDQDATVGGTVDFGDGDTETVFGPSLTRNSNGDWESYRIPPHDYAAKGTYTIAFTLAAHFKRGDISSSLSTQFEIK